MNMSNEEDEADFINGLFSEAASNLPLNPWEIEADDARPTLIPSNPWAATSMTAHELPPQMPHSQQQQPRTSQNTDALYLQSSFLRQAANNHQNTTITRQVSNTGMTIRPPPGFAPVDQDPAVKMEHPHDHLAADPMASSSTMGDTLPVNRNTEIQVTKNENSINNSNAKASALPPSTSNLEFSRSKLPTNTEIDERTETSHDNSQIDDEDNDGDDIDDETDEEEDQSVDALQEGDAEHDASDDEVSEPCIPADIQYTVSDEASSLSDISE